MKNNLPPQQEATLSCNGLQRVTASFSANNTSSVLAGKKLTAAQKHGAKIKREYDIYPFVHFITLFSYKSVITNHNFFQEQ